MEIRLKVVAGPAAGREFDFRADERIVIGRSFSARASLPEDPQISKSHCAIVVVANGCFIEDLDSRNGTLVNGAAVTHGPLCDGDRITVGDSRLEVAFGPPAAPQAGPAPGACTRCRRRIGVRALAADGDGRLGREYVCADCRRDLLAVPVAFDNYEVVRTLATTPGSRIYLARDRAAGGRTVTLKVLQLEAGVKSDHATRRVLRFLLEAECLRQLDHPGIVRLLNAGFDKGRVFLALEYLAGGTLREYVDAHKGPVALDEAAGIAVQVLDALGHAHAHKIIHRDIKPENILLAAPPEGAGVATREGHVGGAGGAAPVVKLADFGLSKCLLAAGFMNVSMTGEAAGTPEYMAPDQLERFSEADPGFDVYALGATLQFLLTKRSIFESLPAEPYAMVHTILHGKRLSLRAQRPDLPRAVVEAVDRALARDPAQRPSVTALAAPFRAVLADPDAGESPTMVAFKAVRRRKR